RRRLAAVLAARPRAPPDAPAAPLLAAPRPDAPRVRDAHAGGEDVAAPSRVDLREACLVQRGEIRHAAEHEATKAHRLLAPGVPAKDVGTRAGPNSAAGTRGRRRSAHEAPRAPADRGTPL